MTLLDLLDDAARTTTRLVFLPQNETMEFGAVWQASETASRWFLARDQRTVGVVMETEPDCLAAVFGAFRAGVRVVSLPLPPRGGSLERYQTLILTICSLAAVEMLLVAPEYVDLIPTLPTITVLPFGACTAAAPTLAAPPTGEAEFVQFTSGSTAEPKGVQLSLAHLEANVLALVRALEPQPGDVACSWLPLSHDMGFVGMTLTALCAGGPQFANGGDIVLMRPSHFVKRPQQWLAACSQYGATFTAAPDFGFDLALRRTTDATDLDLCRLRVCITGAEPVRATTLRRFSAAFASAGFDELAFCPAYGLAEATLAVTMTRPTEMWSTTRVTDPDGHGQELVSAGTPLATVGVTITVDDDEGGGRRLIPRRPNVSDRDERAGRISVSGPSVFVGYLGAPPITSNTFQTQDLGFFRDGRLFVTGRHDDVLLVAGRKLYAPELEEEIELTGLVRKGNAAVTSGPDGELIAIAELDGDAVAPATAAQRVRSRLSSSFGIAPTEVLFVERGTLPKTSSGKPRRWEVADRYAAEELIIVFRRRYR